MSTVHKGAYSNRTFFLGKVKTYSNRAWNLKVMNLGGKKSEEYLPTNSIEHLRHRNDIFSRNQSMGRPESKYATIGSRYPHTAAGVSSYITQGEMIGK